MAFIEKLLDESSGAIVGIGQQQDLAFALVLTLTLTLALALVLPQFGDRTEQRG